MQDVHSFRHWHRISLATGAMLQMTLLSGCSAERTVVSSVKSPDVNNEVEIVSVGNAGPGQNAVSLVVQFRNKHADNFKEISVFNGNGVIEPTAHVAWRDNSTLLVTYSNANIGFQAVKIGTVSIVYERKN
jgi:hypothetical protein